jgi:ornithine cyclodeaminase
MIEAGVNDMHKCVGVMEEMFESIGKGDYVMGGGNQNSHGIQIVFPKESPFPNMPLAGPDRRFMAMPAYLGGRFNIAGEKWYGSNRKNIEKGLPRSILMVCLNDVDTGAPIAFMSANLISAVRTGAIPGVAAKYLARPDAKVLGIVGAGVIGRTCFMAIKDTCPNLRTVKIFDVAPVSAENLANFVREKYPDVTPTIVSSMQEALVDADVVNVATSGAVRPYIEEAWLKEGVLLTLPASMEFAKEFTVRTKKVIDNWKMYEAWREEFKGLEGGYEAYIGLLAAFFLKYIDEGSMHSEDIIDLGDVIVGKKKGRENDSEKIIFVCGGMPLEDIAWGYQIYEQACKEGIGTKLNLWDKPYLA